MEWNFGERIKKYRREKNLTQQELADQLQVSNKTVSRWESGGGYPDVPVLVPLARALGVTVDDLLNEEKPVRAMTKEDWQSLLSFAFVLGGGVLFYLLDLFMPTLVCYLMYLGCMAYGVYLQRHYSYQSRWFYWGNALMNFAVNLSLAWKAGYACMAAGAVAVPSMWVPSYGKIPWMLPAIPLAALVLTAATMMLVRHIGRGKPFPHYAICVRKDGLRWYFPALGILLLTLFWAAYDVSGLPAAAYRYQSWFYYGLLSALALSCLTLFLQKSRRFGYLASCIMVLGGLCLPVLAVKYAWVEGLDKVIDVTDTLSSRYPRFGAVSPLLTAVGATLVLLCIALAVFRLEKRSE